MSQGGVIMAEIRGIPFTENQSEAVKNLKQNLAITAGAGSGKTRVLTERYLEILLKQKDGLMYQKDALERIVAITFTKKAASEMKDRIRQRLKQYFNDNSNQLTQQEKDWIIYLLDNISQARISTIHSFCRELLRENLFSVGFKEDFEILEGLKQENLLNQAVTEVVDEIRSDKEHSLYNLLWELNYSYGKKKLFNICREMLLQRNQLDKLLNELQNKELKVKLEELISNDNFKQLKGYLTKEEFQATIQALSQLESKNDSAGVKKVKQVVELAEKLLATLEQFQAQTDAQSEKKAELLELHFKLLKQLYNAKKDKAVNIYGQMNASDWVGGNDTKLKANTLFNELIDLIPNAGQKVVETSTINSAVITKLLKLYRPLAKKYQQLKLEQGFLDFIDLEKRVAKKLQEDYQLVKKLRAKIEFMLVDEFQDTNQMQWDILRPLVTTDEAKKELVKGKLFIVGDPKQSIYGFRRADVRIFNQVMNKIVESNPTGKIKLSKNFRSNRAIIEFINHIFDNIFPTSQDQADEYDVLHQQLSFGRNVKYQSAIETEPDSHLELLLTPYSSDDEADKGDYEGQLLAEKIKWLVEESEQKIFKNKNLEAVDYGDIAILMRSRTRLKKYETALERAGIDYQTVKGVGFYQHQEIYDIYLALKVLLTPEDDAASYGLFRSPLFAISDDQLFKLMIKGEKSLLAEVCQANLEIADKFSKWQRLKQEASLDQLITTILIDCGAYASYLAGSAGEQRRANLKKIIAEASEFAQQEGNNLYLFLEQLKQLMEEEEGEGEQELITDKQKVKLMTIHAAKGKEFPVVFIADLNHPGHTPSDDLICAEIDGREEIGVKYYKQDLKQAKSSSYQIIKNHRQAKEEFESKRVFYVGATRAEEMLFLSSAVRLSSKGKVKLNNGLKWLMQGLDYKAKELSQLLASDKTEELKRLSLDNGRQLELKLTVAKPELPDVKTKQEIVAVNEEKELYLLTKEQQKELTTKIKSPSSLVKKERNTRQSAKAKKAEIAWQSKSRAALKGSLVHEGIEMLIKTGAVDFDYLTANYSALLEEKELKTEVTNTLEKIKTSAEFQKITAGECKTEVEFFLADDENEYLTGSIDLLFKDSSGKWAVVDWKTNQINSQADIKKHLENYQPQLKAYQKAVKKMTGQKEVATYLYFTEAEGKMLYANRVIDN